MNIDTKWHPESLPTEVELDPIRADSLILLQANNRVLYHPQTPTSVPSYPLRMFDYWVRLYRQYECPMWASSNFFKRNHSVAAVEQFSASNTQHRYRVIWSVGAKIPPHYIKSCFIAFCRSSTDRLPFAATASRQVEMIVETTTVQQNILSSMYWTAGKVWDQIKTYPSNFAKSLCRNHHLLPRNHPRRTATGE